MYVVLCRLFNFFPNCLCIFIDDGKRLQGGAGASYHLKTGAGNVLTSLKKSRSCRVGAVLCQYIAKILVWIFEMLKGFHRFN